MKKSLGYRASLVAQAAAVFAEDLRLFLRVSKLPQVPAKTAWPCATKYIRRECEGAVAQVTVEPLPVIEADLIDGMKIEDGRSRPPGPTKGVQTPPGQWPLIHPLGRLGNDG